jgi:hypothetical protein
MYGHEMLMSTAFTLRVMGEVISRVKKKRMIQQMPRSHWEPLPRPGAVGVTIRVMLKRAGTVVANLKFSPSDLR